jgi:hypothetical protein
MFCSRIDLHFVPVIPNNFSRYVQNLIFSVTMHGENAEEETHFEIDDRIQIRILLH